MTLLQRGMRGKITQLFDITQDIILDMQTAGAAVYDYTCFGVDSDGQLSDDRYMIFYNQPQSPGGEIACAAAGQGARFRFRLSALPQTIHKLVFTVSIDGAGTMGQIRTHTVSVSQNGTEQLRLSLNGSDFQNERAIISLEIYRRDEWRFAAVASGFNGGLGDLLRFFGGEEVTEQSAPQSAPEPLPEPAAEPVTAPVPEQHTPEPIPEPAAEPVQEPVLEYVPETADVPAFPGQPDEIPVITEAKPEPDIPAEAPAYEEPVQQKETPVQAKPPVRSASYRFPDPVRIPPPVIPPPVITPPVIPVPQIRPTENTTHTVIEDDFAEMQYHEDIIINELMEDE